MGQLYRGLCPLVRTGNGCRATDARKTKTFQLYESNISGMKVLLLLTLLGTFVYPATASTSDLPRSCPGRMQGAPCSEFWAFDTVFIGTVTKLVQVPFGEGPRPDWQEFWKVTATLTVDETFRGKLGPEVVFEMGDCYFDFKQDEKYLIYANKGEGGKLSLRRHYNRTRPLSEAREDLDFIRSLPAALPGGRIYGTVYDYRGSVTLRVDGESDVYDRKMPGVIIFLRSGEKTYQTISDGVGQFEFRGVVPGTYDMTTDLPDFLSGSRQSLTAIDKGCLKVDMSVQATGEIKGRVIGADGQPVENAVVSIFSEEGVKEDMFDRIRSHSMMRSVTSKDGSFGFLQLRSGRYHLAINMVEKEREKDSRASDHPRIFYPGVASFKEAKPIVVADGAKLANIEIKLPAPTVKSTPNP